LCEYVEQAATVSTPNRKKIDAADRKVRQLESLNLINTAVGGRSHRRASARESGVADDDTTFSKPHLPQPSSCRHELGSPDSHGDGGPAHKNRSFGNRRVAVFVL
jgi:hypothetical protein